VIQYSTGLDYTVTNQLAGLTLDWAVGDVTVKSVTGYLYQDDLKRNTDVDATPFLSLSNFGETTRQLEGSGIDADSEDRQFISQEFNLFGSFFDDKVDYTLGIYGSDEEIKDQVGGQTLALGGWLGRPVTGSTDVNTIPPSFIGFQPAQLVDFTSTSAAAFGQLIYNYSEMWQFTLGGRWTWEEKKIDQDNYITTQDSKGEISREAMTALADFLQPITRNSEFPRLQDDESWTEFTPTATVTMFAPDSWTEGFLDSGMFYITYSEGFKAGGFTTFGPDRPLAFDPETVKNNEFGFKLEMLDQRMRVNGALYYMDYDDMQLGVTRELSEGDTKFGITNAGKAEMKGVELEVVMLPLEGLLINLTGSYIDASYDEFNDEFIDSSDTVQLTDRSDEPFSYVPEQTYSWTVQYDWNTEFALVTPRISGYYKDKIYTGLDPAAFIFEDEVTLDDYTVWNARLAIQPNQVEGLEVALFAQNFTDEFYYGTGTVKAARLGVASRIRGKPRNYGVDIFYRF
jgi:iron complex outermembrane receptor protein